MTEKQISHNNGTANHHVKNKDEISTQDSKKQEELPKVAYFQLFRFATLSDKILMIVGTIAAIANGFALPAWSFIFGQMVDQFSPTSGEDQLIHNAGVQAMWFGIIGAISFTLSTIQLACWMTSGERQAICYRRNYFSAILRQEVGWFDKTNPNELSTKIATECFQIQGAISGKVPTFIMTLAMFFAGFIVAYIRGWQMSLVVSSTIPVIFIGGMVVSIVMKKGESVSQAAYSSAAGCAEQSLNAIKTVKSLNGSEYETLTYSSKLIQAFKINVKFGAVTGFGIGLTFCCMFLAYSLSFWYGGKLISDGTINTIYDRAYTSGDVMVCFFSILMGGFSLGQIAPCIKDFMAGQQAAVNVFAVLDRVPEIKNIPNPKTIPNLQGKIQLNNITFSYPMKPDLKAVNNVTLDILPNQKTALVGESGCGKSTIMQLIERFYDPLQGSITLDGIDIKQLNLKWMRNQIGYVGQEPVLFAATIRENLQFGNTDASDEEMIGALKQANAWDFVSKLEKRLDTYVGTMGNQFSGGQKQRICIARAILKNPKILLLDEATSALDRKNEREIQETLDYVSSGRTTIVIAHRLVTVKNSNTIYVIDQGTILESGNFSSLISKPNGKFAGMAKNQIDHLTQDDMNEDVDENEGLNNKNNVDNIKIVANPTIPQYRKQSYSKENNNNDCENQNQNKSRQNSINNHNNKVKEATVKPILSEEEEKKLKLEQKKKEELEDKAFMARLMKMNKPEQKWFMLGLLVTLFNGTIFPFSGLILGEFITILSKPNDSDFTDKVNILAIYFLIIALSALVLYILQIYLFTRVGEGLTLRLRKDTYTKMMKMPCAWFDSTSNTPGALTSRLASDCQKINILTTNVMSLQLQNLSCLLSGLIIAFISSWRVTLVGLGMMPLMMFAGYLQAQFNEGWTEQTDKVYKGSSNIVTDAVTNIRTVASFANENKIMEMFENTLKNPSDLIKRKSIISGLTFGFSQLSMFAIYAVIFYVSAYFVRDYGLDIRDMYISMFCILFAGFGAGSNNAFMGDLGAAKAAARNIFSILDAQDEFQIQQTQHQSQNLQLKSIGKIIFNNVSFSYPTRDNQVVLKNLSFTIEEGQHVGFVGPSGCGKSTIMQILLRFYDNYEGLITINGIDIRQYEIQSLRSAFGVVFQDPMLFDATFKDNISYNTENITMQEIRQAAIQANALQFIEGDEKKPEYDNDNKKIIAVGQGFDRKVGIKGSQISGGQKQRIAVARAIIKQPKVMLLDEATSALDQDNEILLQTALDKILIGKTSLTIAHRINTIRNSDIIYVMHDGVIVEQGKYDQLMELKGFFYNINHN